MRIKEVTISDTEIGKPIYNSVVDKAKIESQVNYSSELNLIQTDNKTPKKTSTKVIDFLKERKYLSFLFIILLILAIASISSFYASFNQHLTTSTIVDNSETYIPAEKALTGIFHYQYFDIRIAQEPKSFESPLNGVLLSKVNYDKMRSKYPIAVLIDNEVNARNQTGLSAADLVYEAPVEGGITRYLAIFWTNELSNVGPIRSARTYFIDWLSPFDALFSHDGCAESTDSRVNACASITAFNIKDVGTFGSWRSTDNGKIPPHNEYTSLIKIWDYATSNGWATPEYFTAWIFKDDMRFSERGENRVAKITFTNNSKATDYAVEWNYDKDTNEYFRKVGGKPDLDTFSLKQISAKVIIVEEIAIINTNDDLGHIIIETTGTGNAKILQDGKVYDATWKKNSRSERTIYFYKDNKEVVFNRGLIWIESLPRNEGKFTIE
jgi:hypothetical protein